PLPLLLLLLGLSLQPVAPAAIGDITITTKSPDSSTLPEPILRITPTRPNGVYFLNEILVFNCSINDASRFDLNNFLTVSFGDQMIFNDPNEPFVSVSMIATEAKVACSLKTHDGRERSTELQLLVRPRSNEADVEGTTAAAAATVATTTTLPPPLPLVRADDDALVNAAKSKSILPVLILLISLLLIVISVAVVFVRRRINKNQEVPREDPTVGFANPGFGNELGDEVKIRGLGAGEESEWQRNAQGVDNGVYEENGEKYSELLLE
ncbi:hypothetical protein PENTCL1PPCAC_13925, partial [Pristionchus entomophagus]